MANSIGVPKEFLPFLGCMIRAKISNTCGNMVTMVT